MTYQTLIYSVEKDIVRITINRPAQLNAIDVLTAKELALAAKQCSADPAVRCVVLTGAGDRAFCAGGDVAGFASDPERVDSLIEEGSDLRVRAHAGDAHRRSKRHGSWRRPRPRGGRRSRCRFPVGKIHQRLHEDRAHPDGSTTWFMPRLIGHRRTKELFLLNRVLSADEAMAWGLVNRVVAPEELAATVDEIARQLARGPTLAFAAVKRLLLSSDDEDLEQQMKHESASIVQMSRSHDGLAGVKAFKDKVEPSFTGS